MDATLTIDHNRGSGLERQWTRLVSFVAAPGDDEETLRKKRLLLVVVLAKAPVCPSLAVAFYTLGVPFAALVPIVYQALTVASVIVFLITRNFERFRLQQALIIFVGPIALHYFLGGFVNSSGMGVEVASRERRLRAQVEQLVIAIDEERKAAQVAEITESDYFQKLKARAKVLVARNAARTPSN